MASSPVATALVSEIVALHGEIVTAARTSLDKAIRIGELLASAKAGLPHGQWLPWLKANIPFAERTARNYMRCHTERDRLKSASVADLTDAYRLLAPPAEPDATQLDEQRQADYARLRILGHRLASPDLTIQDCVTIKNEAGEMEKYWGKVSLDAERNLGIVLNEAEKLGIKDEVLAEVNRVLRASQPASKFIPEPGHVLQGHGVIGGTHYVAFIVPYVQQGFYFVNVISSDAGRKDSPGTMDFLRKPIRGDYLGGVIETYVPNAEALTWEQGPCAKPWEYDELAYSSHQHYMDALLKGDTAA